MGCIPMDADKYKIELTEILYEIIESDPLLFSHIGEPLLFNWRALFDFSSEVWNEFSIESRSAIINALAEKRSLFIAIMTFKTMYIEMDRPDIAGAACLSLARYLEDLSNPAYIKIFSQAEFSFSENFH